MKLVSFSVQNYRSITRAHKIRIGRSTILIGPNNEGKSNLLRAMVTAMRLLALPRERLEHVPMDPARRLYDWGRDFPIPLQDDKPNGESVFTLEFELSADDVDAFWVEVRSRINGTLPVQLSVGKKPPTIKIIKKGPGGEALSKKRDQIAKFVASRIDIQYIPAVRTAESALEVVEVLLSKELRALEANDAFRAAVDAIAKVQQPILQNVAESIQKTLSVFLPDVHEVSIQIPAAERLRALRRSVEFLIDDGTKTLLQHKGDGVQSLAALALTRHLSESGALGKDLLIAIEEPEAHLHPNAIHQVRSVLRELAAKQRLVISTHCPLLVDRSDIRNNILVTGNKARPAAGIEAVRELLGVRASDNLRHAELVLLVEGKDDKVAADALLRATSASLMAALDQGALVVEEVGGAANIAYKAGLIRDSLCELHLFLDADEAGKKGADEAKRQGIVADMETNFATCLGMQESEFEDLYSVEAYKDVVKRKYGVALDVPLFKGNKKWSVRVGQMFVKQGKMWDDEIKMRVKADVAAAVAGNPAGALEAGRRSSFDALVRQLEERVADGASLDVA